MPACRQCGGRSFTHAAVSGEGEVYSFTVNWQRWNDDLDPPYVIAIVELAEQGGLRLTSNLIRVAEDDLRIGMPVQVAFVRVGELAIPVFEPR
jgi:uncharacterized OB-fold protein